MKIATLEEARSAKSKATAVLSDLPVVGLGIARMAEGYCLKVNLSGPVEDSAVPANVDGVPVRVEVVGETRKR